MKTTVKHFVFSFFCLTFLSLTAGSQTLTTSSNDYFPGDTAFIYGSGFWANEIVAVVVHHADNTPDSGADHDPWYVTADANGDFVATWHVCEDDCVGSLLRVSADGQSSTLHAEALFTDALSDFYRSVSSGDWNSLSTWESSVAVGGPYVPATVPPTSGSNTITIRNGHTVTMTAVSTGITIDQVTIESTGQLTINSAVTITLGNGSGTDLTVNGTLSLDGTLTLASSSSIDVNGTFNINSTGLVNGGGGNVASRPLFNVNTGGQWNITAGGVFNSPGGIGTTGAQITVNTGSTATLNGPVTAGTTGTPTTFDGSVTTTSTISIAGGSDLQIGGNVSFGGAVTIGGSPATMNVTGTVTSSANITLGSVSNLQVTGSLTMTAGTLTVQRGNGGTLGSINNGGTLTLSGSSVFAIIFGNATYTVASGGTLDMGPNALVNNTGSLIVASGANLKIGSADGITHTTTTGNVRTSSATADSYSTSANYTCNGTAAQVTGAALPLTVNDLTINNTSGTVTPTNNITTTGTLSVLAGATFQKIGTFTLTVGAGGVSNAGTITLNGNTAACPETDLISIQSSVPATQRSWTGGGAFNLTDVSVQDQAGSALITVLSGTNVSNNGSNWTFITSCTACVAPSFTACSSNITDNTAAGTCALAVSYTATAAGTSPVVTYAFTGATTGSGSGTGSGSTFNKGTTAVAITATNTCGSATCNFNITINDITAPVADALSLADATGQCSASIGSAPTATDNCSGSIIGTTSDATSRNTQGDQMVTWTFNDGNGNTSTQTQWIRVHDTTAPVADAVSLADATGQCSASISSAPTATDNCSGSITGTTSDATSRNTQGDQMVTWTFNDGNGNTSTQTQWIRVHDTTAPVADAVSLADATGQCSASIGSPPTATDNCSGSITGTTSDATSRSTQGDQMVTWAFNDGNGNTSTQTQWIRVHDTTAPLADAVSLADATGQCSASIISAPTATDNCGGSITGTTSDATSRSTQGDQMVTWTFNDGNGNTSTQTQWIRVHDTTAPVADALSLADVTGQCSASISSAPTATDNCGGSITGTTSDATSRSTQGDQMVTWTFNDGNGNTSTQTQWIRVHDTTAPVADALSLADVTGQCSASISSAPTATDNCGGSITGTTSDATSRSTQGDQMVTWTFNDGNGNTSTQTQWIRVHDTNAPVADAVSLADVTGQCSASIGSAPTATDNCSGSITGTTSDATSRSTQGDQMVTWTFNDGNGNTSTQTQWIRVHDTTAPVANVVSLADATGQCSASIGSTPTATDNCSGSITGTTSDATSRSTQGDQMVTWTFNDGNGNTSTQTQWIRVHDTTAPVADAVSLADATGQCSASIGSAPTATDNCSGSITGTTTDATSRSTQGDQMVTWTFNDGNGNTSTQTQWIRVHDTTAPVANVVSLADATGQCSASIGSAPTATDNCSGSITGTTSDATSRSTQGDQMVTWNFNDGNGNTSTQTQWIRVHDTTAPVANVVSLADATGQCSASIGSAPTATDNCSGSITGTTTDATSRSTQGDQMVTWNFNDGNGNTSTQTQWIRVHDTTAPVANVVSLADATGQCSASIGSAPTATDNCSGSITGTTSDATSRSTQGDQMVTWTFNDGHGNTSTQTQWIRVHDTNAPVADAVSLADATGQCSASIGSAPTATDNCSGSITGTTSDATSRSTQGDQMVTWNFNDGNGNTSTQTQWIRVHDITAPVADAISLADATGQCSASIGSAPTATDNCGGSITGTTSDATSRSTQGDQMVTWTFNDGHGNTSTQTQWLRVHDTTAPVAEAVSLADATGQCSASISTAPSATDNCSGSIITGTTSDATSRSTQGDQMVTWTFNDGHGNTSTQTQWIKVHDTTVPVPNAISLPDATGLLSASISSAPSATDNCGGSITGITSDATSHNTQGDWMVTWTFNDGNGNTSTQTQWIRVHNTSLPTVTCPGNITGTVNHAGCTRIVTYNVSYTGNGATLAQTTGLPSGSAFPKGTTTNTFVVTDALGNTASCSFTVTVTSTLALYAGADEQTYFGYNADQTVNRIIAATGGGGGYSYSFSLSRPLMCNILNSTGDEAFSGGSCTNNSCPSSGSPSIAPSCSNTNGSISVKLIEDAEVCVTVIDAFGCTATDCFHIDAVDARCFSGNSGVEKVKVCHHTSSNNNPWVQLCIAQGAVAAHLAENSQDYIGTCGSRLDNTYSGEIGMSVYPNPAQNQMTVEFDSPSNTMYQIAIFDITGRAVVDNKGFALEGENKVVLPITDIAPGFYNIRLTVDDESSSVRLVVTK